MNMTATADAGNISPPPTRLRQVAPPDTTKFRPLKLAENDDSPLKPGICAPAGDGDFIGSKKAPAPNSPLYLVRRAMSMSNKKIKTVTTFGKGKSGSKSTPRSTEDEPQSSPPPPKSMSAKKIDTKPTPMQQIAKNLGSAWTGMMKKSHSTKRDGTGGENKIEPMSNDTKPAAIRFVEPNKYFIEYYQGLSEPVLFGDEEGAGMRHGVMIHHCEDVTIQITKKVNKLELDNCKKVTVILPAVLASIDLQHCTSCEVRVTTRLPGLSIDNSTSINVYIPRESMGDIEMASSGGGSANVLVPKEDDETDYQEFPIPFQFVHHFKDGKMKSEASPLYFH